MVAETQEIENEGSNCVAIQKFEDERFRVLESKDHQYGSNINIIFAP
jgi:hypothetical protein